jgi:hypothetical protein
MSKNRSSFLKRDREARKREKAAMKVQRREDRKRGDLPEGQTEYLDNPLDAPEGMSDDSQLDQTPNPLNDPPQQH